MKLLQAKQDVNLLNNYLVKHKVLECFLFINTRYHIYIDYQKLLQALIINFLIV